MSVKTKLIAIMIFVAIVPLSVSALSTLGIHQRAFDERLKQLYLSNARYGAKVVQFYLDSANKSLEALISGSIRWDSLSADERNGALWLIYGQLDSILAVSLLDREGNGIGASVYVSSGSDAYPEHPRTTLEDLDRFGRSIPFEQAKLSGNALGVPFLGSQGDAVFIPLAFALNNASDGSNNMVAVAISLAALCRELDHERIKDTAVNLLDERNRYVCRFGRVAALTSVEASLIKQIAGATEGTTRVVDEQGQDTLAAYAATPYGWKVVVRQPTRSALAPSVRMRQQTFFWIGMGVIAALGAGVFLAQGINKPIENLAKGAGKIATGDFTYRFEDHEMDEFGKLSDAFNHMCGEIEKRDTAIRAWNQQLQERVEQRTQELKEAQSALLQSRKLAAVASLGAGVAHEINNPLTGVIGLTQLLIRKTRDNAAAQEDTTLLCQIEREGLRIRDITQKMLSLSENYGGGGFERLNMAAILDRVVDEYATRMADAAITVVRNYSKDIPLVYGNAQQLEQALTQVVDNALISMAERGGQLIVSASTVEGELVKISIKDMGKGIKPEYLDKVFDPFFTTKDDWKGEGLGLSLAYRIVETHHGTIKIKSVVGEGTTITITLPTVRPGAHLI